MKEIETMVMIYNKDEAVKALGKFQYLGQDRIVDRYFFDPLRENLLPNNDCRLRECFRVRRNNNYCSMTYKIDHFTKEDIWLYSDEHETRISSESDAYAIINQLGLKELVSVIFTVDMYMTCEYTISLEDVEGLGCFLEVEYCTSDNVDVFKIKDSIASFINELDIACSGEINMGKPEMLLRKKDFYPEICLTKKRCNLKIC